MDYNTYREIYGKLATKDALESLQSASEYDDELLMVIYTQRVVREATKAFYRVKRHASRLHRQWKNGASFVALARRQGFPPILMALIVLEEDRVSRRQFWKILSGLDEQEDDRLKRELLEACQEDLVYSPAGTEKQYERGAWGEERLWSWLQAEGIAYRSEEELRAQYEKTPDALLEEPLTYNGSEIVWIESKATFGDPVEVKRHTRRQLRPYVDLFGEGLVIYWFGYAEDVDLKLPEGVVISDGKDFEEIGQA